MNWWGTLCALSLALAAMPAASDDAVDSLRLSPALAALEGVHLFVVADGEKPCDYFLPRLNTDTRFVLNAADIPFSDDWGQVAKDLSKYTHYAYLTVTASSLKVSGGCVWLAQVQLEASLINGVVLGSAHSQLVPLWTGIRYGTSPGNGQTAFVSDFIQEMLREMSNDIRTARRLWPGGAPIGGQ